MRRGLARLLVVLALAGGTGEFGRAQNAPPRFVLALMRAIGPTVVEPKYEYDVVWRIPETSARRRSRNVSRYFPQCSRTSASISVSSYSSRPRRTALSPIAQWVGVGRTTSPVPCRRIYDAERRLCEQRAGVEAGSQSVGFLPHAATNRGP